MDFATHENLRTSAKPSTRRPDAVTRHWVVPLDETGHCTAALEFAKWLDGGNSDHTFHGVHVPAAAGVASIVSNARAHDHVTESSANNLLEDVTRTEPDLLPSNTLVDLDPDILEGLIVARRADATGPGLVRLGGLARRLAGAASTPVAIVPHDFERRTAGHGPVLLALHPSHTPGAAAEIAKELARSKHLDIVAVHVAEVEVSGALIEDPEVLREAYATAERDAMVQIQQWTEHFDMARAWRYVVRGDVRFAIENAARRFDASVIVCGTRQRSILQRLVDPSAALEIARYSARPVVLVPTIDANGD